MAQAPKIEATDENTAGIDTLADRWERYVKAKAAEKVAKSVVEETKREIVGLLRDNGAEFATVAGTLVARYRAVPTTRLDEKKLRESYPEAYEACLVTADVWRLEQVK